MAKTKEQLIKEGKELGLNLTTRMSVYELEHRIQDKKSELDKVEVKKSTSTKKGEY